MNKLYLCDSACKIENSIDYLECLNIVLQYHGQGDQMEWIDAHVTLACELMAEQVSRGNRPNTHLNTVGYTEVSDRFFQLTGISLSKTQIKNKS